MVPPRHPKPWHIVGVMSGTSLDGADAVIVKLLEPRLEVIAHAHRPFAEPLRNELLALQARGDNELDRAARAGLQLATHYATLVQSLLSATAFAPDAVRAVALHGQTVRHCPGEGYTIQLNAPAHVAELLGIDVICDFRSRDVAAGGQGAPLVPAFHAAVFGDPVEHRAIVNLGGMANVSDLPPGVANGSGPLRGWDTGPGNVFLDAWYGAQHRGGRRFDQDGAFASTGRADPALLARLLDDSWFAAAPPKSTGRDHFNDEWLKGRLGSAVHLPTEDVQATLAELTAQTIADTMCEEIPDVMRVIVAGGGARNADVLRRLEAALQKRLHRPVPVVGSDTLGIHPEHVEAAAFAWLGACFLEGKAGNRPGVTGARGPRILGALYPA